MSYINPTVAYFTTLGYTACPSCADGRDDLDVAADSGNSAVDGLCCDYCHEPITYDPRLVVPRS